MEKNRLLSKLNISMKDYNNELEKILEHKLFSYEVKNLLLSMLYKIEDAYKDFEIVKVETPPKSEYIEDLLRIIKEKALTIFLAKSGTAEAKELEAKQLSYEIDKKNGKIICIQNELVMLCALFKLDETNILMDTRSDYVEEPLKFFLNQGRLDSHIEVIRDFNGWSWDIVTKDIVDLEYNLMYQIMVLLDGRKHIKNKKYEDVYQLLEKMAIEKYIKDKVDEKYINDFEEIRKNKSERLKLFDDKKNFLDQITIEKRQCTKEIERIDKILNNKDLLKEEYYNRNKKLPNKEKIFSVSYLVGILEKERMQLLDKINECNKIILPKEFVEEKNRLEKETNFLNSIAFDLPKEDIIDLCNKFLIHLQENIEKMHNENKESATKQNEEEKQNLTKWIYKLRSFCYIPLADNFYVKDLEKLKDNLEKIFRLIIKKAQEIKLWDTFTEDNNITYDVLKEIFITKIIKLENINIQCRYEENVLYVEYYDDTVIDSSIQIHIDNVRIKKKFKLFI